MAGTGSAGSGTGEGRLIRIPLAVKFSIAFVALVTLVLLVNGAVNLWLAYGEARRAAVLVSQEKAQAAAERITQFVSDIESQIGWTTRVEWSRNTLDQKRYDFIRLLLHAPAITEARYIDPDGKEQLKQSRLDPDQLAGGQDFSSDPKFAEAVAKQIYYGPVFFKRESEPYFSLSVAHARKPPGVTAVEVNLKLISDVVNAIQIGEKGKAFIVDRHGLLIAHPNMSLVLKATDMSSLPQVASALANAGGAATTSGAEAGRDAEGEAVLTAHAVISKLGWTVFVQLPEAEAVAPVVKAFWQTIYLLGLGLLLATLMGSLLAHRMLVPIRRLQAGAERLGAGDFDQHIDIRSGDEIETLGARFNDMAGKIKESYATLESKVEARTRDLNEALEQQTGTSRILQVIAASPTNINPVLLAVAESACGLCDAYDCAVLLKKGDDLYFSAHYGAIPIGIEKWPVNRQWTAGRAAIDKAPVHVHDLRAPEAEEFTDGRELSIQMGHRTIVSVPLLREGESIGALVVRRREVQPFSDKQIALLQTFADQAVIAINNVHLFDEVQARTRDLGVSLERQTATSEILRVISQSPNDTTPVFEAIALAAIKLLRCDLAGIGIIAGKAMVPKAVATPRGLVSDLGPEHDASDPDASFPARALAAKKTLYLPDWSQTELPEKEKRVQAASGLASAVYVPMLRGGECVGMLIFGSKQPNAFDAAQIAQAESFADQALIAVENVRLFNETKEALEQQTATADVLKVISRSAFDLKAVLTTLIETGARLCDAPRGVVWLPKDEKFHLEACVGYSQEWIDIALANPVIPDASGQTTAAIATATGRMVHVEDFATDPRFLGTDAYKTGNYRAALMLPLLRDGRVEGTIGFTRAEPGLFTPRQVELVQTFADQAVIAINNVRLFDEVQAKTRDLTETLERQTATNEILSVISRSPSDLMPVLETISDTAARLCGSEQTIFFRFDGAAFRLLASWNFPDEVREMLERRPITLGHASALGRAGATLKPVYIPDVLADPGYGLASEQKSAKYRTTMAVPLLREGRLIGALSLNRSQPGAFTAKHAEIVGTFADQAAIAIENVRLFDEVQARTKEVTEALEYQTATSDVLGVISRSPSEVQPVLDTIVATARRLCGAGVARVWMLRGDAFELAASTDNDPARIAFLKANPIATGPGSVAGRAVIERQAVHVDDVKEIPDFQNQIQASSGNMRTLLAVPLLREGVPIGVISASRTQVQPFTPRQIDLMKTFADQAVIAIGNARLFEEVQARTREVTEALEQQTATSDVLKVISRSVFDLDNVLKTLIDTAVRLCKGSRGTIFLCKGDKLVASAFHSNVSPALREYLLSIPDHMHQGGLMGRAVRTGEVVHVPDMTREPDLINGELRARADFGAILSVPLMRDGVAVGVFGVPREKPVAFTDREIELVKSFADQAVIAIENSRLFEEVQARTRELTVSLQQQTATAEVLKVISRSAFDLPAVLNALLESAAKLCDAKICLLFQLNGGVLKAGAAYGGNAEFVDFFASNPLPVNRMSIAGRTVLEQRTVHVPDIEQDPEFALKQSVQIGGWRSIIGVPLMREGVVIGALALARATKGPFTPKQIELTETFADQAVIAIENTRLFEAEQTRTRELAASLDNLRATQDRLVQSEKLASLGQLTAGIAHEIKNPLNFVNNFADVSGELVDELTMALDPAKAVLDAGTRAEVDDLTSMLKANLAKVTQHGRRADSIVKNMLLHSRSGVGERRRVDLNATVEESLNLAYHGARAEKPGFNITLEKSFDPAVGEVEIFPQEFIRVLLNLISNGFYAATKRKLDSAEAGYEPKLLVATQSLGDSVAIRIRDNGTGIPEEVKAKMFNPFFTTKPAGEGTGLGLSLSYDIIKQHHGAIEVATEPGVFTQFTITLPREDAIGEKARAHRGSAGETGDAGAAP